MRNRLLFIFATFMLAFTFVGLNAQKRFDSKKLYTVSSVNLDLFRSGSKDETYGSQ